MTFAPKMTSNFWRHCAISALKISKNQFATFDFFLKKMKLVSTVWVSTSLSKSGYSQGIRQLKYCEITLQVCTKYLQTTNAHSTV